MGFAELFASSLGDAARVKAVLNRGLSGWLETTLAIVRVAGPAIQSMAYSALWAEVDSVKELAPLTLQGLLQVLRVELATDRVRAQKCTGATTSRFCSCGGFPAPPEVVWEKEEIPFPDCPKNRRLCTAAVKCKRHGGAGFVVGDVEVFLKAPECAHCNGTGFIPRGTSIETIRAEYDRQRKTYARPSNPLHEWVLEEGATSRFATRCQNWRWTSKSKCGETDVNPCDSSTWMAAAQILIDNSDAQVCYPGSVYNRLRGGAGGYDDWCHLPPNREMCNRLFDWWHRKYTPDYSTPEDTLVDFVKPRMGECYLPIEKDKHLLPREWSGRVPMGDFSHFEWCVGGLRNSLEEFLDIFYDCAAQFDGNIELCLNEYGRPSKTHGVLGNIQVLFTTPAVCSPAKLLPEIGESDFDELESDEPQSHIPPLFRENGLSALYKNLVLQQVVPSTSLRAHPDQDEVEDQLDHLENKQGGEIITTPSFIKMLKEKRKEVRGKEFRDGAEGRLIRSADLELSKKDVFLTHSLMDKFQNMGIVRKYSKSDPKLTKVCVDLTNQEEVVKFPPKELAVTTDGVLSAQTFTVLNRPQFNELNKLAEAGWKEAKSVCLNLHIRSYLPVHLPIYAFCVIMWGHSSNASQASMSGAYVYLGDQEASVLQLPLLCGYIGNSLSDKEAYKRSLVLSTCFFGASGLSSGQNMFGITAVEFTEYLPTSYGGITHERDSWDQMLRNHQAVDKQRFISGFNVVDFVEAGKEKQLKFPEFELQPVPKNQPLVRTFGDTTQPPLGKTCSMRVKTFNAFRAGNIPIGQRTDNTKRAIDYEISRASVSGIAPRLDDGLCNLRASGDYAFGHTMELPATIAAGTIIGTFNIIDSIQSAGTRVCNEWLQTGYVSQNLTMVSHLAPNAYSGVALWYIFDAYGKIPSDITTTIELEVVRSFGPHLHVLKEPATATWLVDFHKMCGQTLNFSGSGYCIPKIWVVAASSVQLARSTAAKFRIEFYTCGERLVKGLAENPLTYPVCNTHLGDLNLVLQSRQLALGTYAMVHFPITLAKKQETATKRVVYSYAAGLLSHFLGIGGTIHFIIDVMSSVFVTSKLRVAIWGKTPTTDELAQMPHVDILPGEKASLLIQSPFYATANFGDSGASFYVSTLCAPMAPESVETAFEYSMRILGIETTPALCREINYKQKFAWFMLEGDNSQAPLSLRVPSRLTNVVSTKVTVTNYTNAFAIMCATAGLHHGNCVLHFSWDWHHSEAMKQTGRFAIATGMGMNAAQEHLGDVQVFNHPQTSYQLPFQFGSFAGPVPSGGVPHDSENWFEMRSPNGSWLTNVYVGIEVLDGFKFYGRSAGPLTVPLAARVKPAGVTTT